MSSNAAIRDILWSPDWVIFTAQNPDNKQLSELNNAALHQQLLRTLKVHSVPFNEVHGRYSGKDEVGVIIFPREKVTRSLAAELAKFYGQESVLTCEGLIYQDGSVHPVIDWVFPATEPEDNYTLFRSTYFRAEINFDVKFTFDLIAA